MTYTLVTHVLLCDYKLLILNDEIRITNAVADYRRREDGTIEVL
jgi:hypothetical protein